MNQNLYRTVFSKALGMLVPVAETARARGKGAGRARGAALPSAPGGLCAIASAAAAVLWSIPALATPPLPTGGAITGGSGSITQNGTTLTVNQASDRLSAQWQSFDIGAGHGVVFNQPSRSSVALNRVVGPDASKIYGSLSANGHVFLVNPNGVLFAPGAQVNVGGLAASTLDISEQDFAAGRYRFTRGSGAGSVVNEGRIDAGSVVLIGPKVVNSGTISTPGGRTTLAAGDQVTVSMLGGLLSAQVDASVANAEIQNHGRILADGGRVDLIAGRADTVLNSLINTEGVIRASSFREESGRIFLDGGAGGTVTVSGVLDASAADGDRGGEVRVLGDQVTLGSGALVDVSGPLSGGTALIGGGFQGKDAGVLNASRTTVEEGAAINADGGEQGGRVIVWSDGSTRYAGSISARGKGFAEVSGKGTLQFSGAVDTGGGTLLLDPTDITVQATPGDGINTFSGAQIATLLGANDVVLSADNLIAWNSGVTLDYDGVGTRSLTLQAGNNITYSGTITDSVAGGDRLHVTFIADADGNGVGSLTINNGSIRTSGGDIVLRGGSGALTALPLFTDPGYAAALRSTAARNATINWSTLDAAGGNITVRGAGIDGGTSAGVSLHNSTIQTSGAGAITIDGIGGVGPGGFNRGIQTSGASNTISTVDGTLRLQGTGSGTGNENSGIRLNPAIVQATGNGDLVINALGSTGGNFNDGIVLDVAARLSVANGNMTVTGTGRGTGIGSDGIELANSSIVEATGTGSVTLNGTSTATGANTNRGITVWLGSTARTTSGALTLEGASSDPAKGNAISLESVTIGGAGQTGAITLQSGGSVWLGNSTIDTSNALSITGGAYTTTGASTLKSDTLAFGNANAIAGSGTLTFNQTANITLANAIGGTVSVAKAGANTLTFAGNNTYSGTTTVNAGTLRAGDGNTNGTIGTGAVTIASGANLVFDRSDTVTVGSVIGGAGNLTQAGTGTTILTGNNTYSGTTAVNAGTLQAGNGGTTGTLGTSAVTVNAGSTLRYFRSNALGIANSISGTGTLEFLGTGLSGNSDYVLNGNSSGFTGTVNIDRARVQYDNANDLGAAATINVLSGGQILASANIPNAMNLNGTGWLHSWGTLGALRLSAGAVASGNIVLQSDASIGAFGSTGTISGVISGAGRALQFDRGTVTLSAAETFTGPLTIKSGSTLVLAPGASLATDSIRIGDISLGGSGGTVLQHQGDNQLSPNAVVTFDAVSGHYSYWQLLGTNQSVAGIMDSTSNGVIENAETQDGFGNGTLTLTGAGSYSYGGYMRDKWSGTSGSLSIVKTGTGTQAFVGGRVNYTGPTTVNNGRLILNTAPAYNSATTVNAGATLELAGNAHVTHLAGFSLALNDGSRLLKTNSGYDTFNSSNVTVNGTVDIEIANSGVNNQLFIGGAGTGLQGSGTINLTNTGAATTGLSLRTGPGNFSGTINVDGGVLNVGSGASLALQNTDLNLTGSAKLNLAGAYAAGASPASVKSLTGASTSTVTLGGQTLTVGTNDGTGGDFAGVISGSGALAKTGTGTQVLSGDNTYTGTTTISGGVLQIGNGGTTGTLGTGAVTNNGSLVFDRSDVLTVANTIAGSGSLTQAGPGTLILTGNNSYSGATTVADGTLQVGNNGTAGQLGTGAVANDGNLVFNRSDSTSLGVLAAGGITGTGNVTALIGGSFNVDRGIALTGASSSILLEAGKNQPGGTATGGDVTLTSNISTSAGGTITIFSGNATTAAYEAQVGGATGATRYKTYSASAAATAGAVAGTRNYYYRQAPSALSVGGLTATKVYDGLRDAATVDTTAAVVNGLIDGDTLAPGALNVTGARFDSAHAGARTVAAGVSSATGPSYSGGGATWSVSGYSTANMAGSGTGTITPRTVTAGINAVGKTYDGQTSTSSTLGPVTGFAGNDSVAGVSGLQLAFDSPNAGARNVVANGTGSLTGFTGAARGDGSGIGAGNEVAGLASDYVFVAPAPAAATITPASLTVRANNDAKIVTQGDTAGYNGVSFTGFVNGESVADLGGALAISRGNAGTEAAGHYAGVLQPSGYTSGNYTISYQAGDFRILPAQQLLVRIQNVNNVYGTTPGYTVTSAQYLAADGTTFHTLTQTARTGDTYTFADGAGGSVTFTVTPQGAVTSGAGHLVVGNYGLAGSNAAITGSNFSGLNYVGNQSVNRAALTPLAGGVSKVYDGTTAMNGLTLGLGGLLAGDAVAASGTGAFASRNAGTNLTYYVDGLALSGADAANYYLASGGSLTGNDGTITPRAITVTAVPATKVYDGNTSAPGTPQVDGSLVGGDSFTRLAQEFANPGVGMDIRLIPTALIEDGNGGANYVLTFVESPLGRILPVPGQPPQPQPQPVADASLPSQAPIAAAFHRGDGAGGEAQGRPRREAAEERLRKRVQVISTGLRLPAGLGASPLDDFEQALK